MLKTYLGECPKAFIPKDTERFWLMDIKCTYNEGISLNVVKHRRVSTINNLLCFINNEQSLKISKIKK